MASTTSIVEASIQTLSDVLSSGDSTAVDLVAICLLRISSYDCSNTLLNAIPLINEKVFEEAATVDDRRGSEQSRGVLDGVPFTVKDSYKVKGMTAASGSEAFENLVSDEDAFLVRMLREAGAVLVGKTNMCPMAYGGMIRGVYGRAESPYNSDYLAAAFGSGSSNGSGVATASSFAVFGLGGETVSSGRSPASNNGLVTYTPSQGLISLRGTWPLYPTCDVAIPHTRCVDDLLTLLDVISREDTVTTGDFWRDQPFLRIPVPWQNPPKSFMNIKDPEYLKGKRIAVPKFYIEQCENGPYVSKAVTSLWLQAKADLEAVGAVIVVVDSFPAVEEYEAQLLRGHQQQQSMGIDIDLQEWNRTERGPLIANAWEDFVQSTKDASIPSLSSVDYTKLFPQLPRSDPQVKYTEPANAVQWSQLSAYVSGRPTESKSYPGKSPIYDTPNLGSALQSLQNMRCIYLEEWMHETDNKYDLVAFPAAGDVAKADADVDEASAKHAWTDGVKYSHGNRAIRHLGIPTVTVPMGLLEDDSHMPMGLTFCCEAYQDEKILKAAGAFEALRNRRVPPPRTPALQTDTIQSTAPARGKVRNQRPKLDVWMCKAIKSRDMKSTTIWLEGTISTRVPPSLSSEEEDSNLILTLYIDGQLVPHEGCIHISQPSAYIVPFGGESQPTRFSCEVTVPAPPELSDRDKVVGKIARDSTMVVMLVRYGVSGWPAGWVRLVHGSDMEVEGMGR